MALPSELISCILFELWATQSSTSEYIQTFSTCSLVSKQWSAIIKEMNSTHSVIPLSYSGECLHTIRSMSSLEKPLLFRAITFKIDYMLKSNPVIPDSGCRSSITANRGIEIVLRSLFNGPNPPPDGTRIFVDYLDDPRVHVPRFWIPPQTTHLTIVYHRRWWVPASPETAHDCQCVRPIFNQQVSQLCIMGATALIVERLLIPLTEWKCLGSLTTDVQLDIPVPSFTQRVTYDYPVQDVGPEFLSRVMFGERGSWPFLMGRDDIWNHGYSPMFEQVIPLGSVGYIDPFSKKFVILFNAIDPASSTEPRIRRIPSILKWGRTKVVTDTKYSPSPAWDHEYKKPGILGKLGVLTKERSSRVPSIPLGYSVKQNLHLGLGRAISRQLVGDKLWSRKHRQTITDVFGEHHPRIRQHMPEIVTATVDSSQYVWFVPLGHAVHNDTVICFYFQVNPQASHKPGNPWGEIKSSRSCTLLPSVPFSWGHISTVGQSPMTVQIRCDYVA
ncbi:uncharacterized protein EV420DRAFT_559541 [Desarmillaria tabescens]|uniref:Uncharacterized protein n=1 Tax=Armillaria tabescens TaxID=1929756 RepID=A0AA39K990_ARMTA|nr:uncharacterized protein EV420DRAFT_559541 [Desarmillaria tabescens]KAK0455775.1 hypothetical protein EV420DRAFT_559541 [Desarmillaria tabescens]